MSESVLSGVWRRREVPALGRNDNDDDHHNNNRDDGDVAS